jgi:hypothetical protein
VQTAFVAEDCVEWRVYSRTGRLFGAEIKNPALVQTSQGLVEADSGDFVVVDEDVTQIRHISADRFSRIFSQIERAIPLKTLAALSSVAVSRVAPISADRSGSDCARCGQYKTTREFEGSPTCSPCELSIRAEREERVECRHDGSLMQKEILEDIIVDRCPECGGVWFDGGELEVLSAAIHRTASPGDNTELASRLLHSLLHARPE